MKLNMYNLDAVCSELESILSSGVDREQPVIKVRVSVLHGRAMIPKNRIWISNMPLCLPSKQHFFLRF